MGDVKISYNGGQLKMIDALELVPNPQKHPGVNKTFHIVEYTVNNRDPQLVFLDAGDRIVVENTGGDGEFVIGKDLDLLSNQWDLLYNGSAGKDKIVSEGKFVGKNVTFNTGDGDDYIDLQENFLADSLDIHTGAGNDQVAIRGQKIDSASRPAVELTKNANGSFDMKNVDIGSLVVDTGEGADKVAMFDSIAAGVIQIALGAGDDTVRFWKDPKAATGVMAGTITIEGDGGSDAGLLDGASAQYFGFGGGAQDEGDNCITTQCKFDNIAFYAGKQKFIDIKGTPEQSPLYETFKKLVEEFEKR